MTGRASVITWFYICGVKKSCHINCPYWDCDEGSTECVRKLAEDVYELITEQEDMIYDLHAELASKKQIEESEEETRARVMKVLEDVFETKRGSE